MVFAWANIEQMGNTLDEVSEAVVLVIFHIWTFVQSNYDIIDFFWKKKKKIKYNTVMVL